MAKKKEGEPCCEPSSKAAGCFKVESVVTVDDRGQMVLPKEIRERAGIKGGDKLAVVIWEKGKEICCISLIKTTAMEGMVKDLLGPIIKDLG